MVAGLAAAGLSPVLIGRPDQDIDALAARWPGVRALPRWGDASALTERLAGFDTVVLLAIAGHFVGQHGPADIPPLVAGNLEYPLTLFEAMTQAGHSRIVNVGTAWEVSDDGAEAPANLYAVLKAANARALAHLAQTAPLRAVQVKLLDSYGGQDRRAKLLPLLRQAHREGREMTLRNPAQTINLCHVTDICEALLAAAALTGTLPVHAARTAHVQGPRTVSIGTLVGMLGAGPAPTLRTRFAEAPKPPARGVWDAAPRLPGWTPRIPLEDGLAAYFGDRDHAA